MINPAALSAIAELFLMNGDMCAWLYTGSPAMHSEKITLFEPETSRLKKAGAGTYGNSFIAIRRWVASLQLQLRGLSVVSVRFQRVLDHFVW
jgi:hypothetical protein